MRVSSEPCLQADLEMVRTSNFAELHPMIFGNPFHHTETHLLLSRLLIHARWGPNSE